MYSLSFSKNITKKSSQNEPCCLVPQSSPIRYSYEYIDVSGGQIFGGGGPNKERRTFFWRE